MKQVVAKLAFVHRRLWQRDKTYRAALLLGPPPLFGCALAVALWVGVHAAGELPAAANRLPPWAHPHGPGTPGGHGGAFAEEPVRRLPPIGTGGTLSGFETGWQGVILPIEVTPTLDVHVLPTPLAMFKLDQTDIDMARITAAGPAAGLYVGVHKETFGLIDGFSFVF